MTTPNGPTVVTGATGNVGLDVARGLIAHGVPVRIAARDPESASALFTATEVVRFDFGDEPTYAATFEGARAVFLVREFARDRARAWEPAGTRAHHVLRAGRPQPPPA